MSPVNKYSLILMHDDGRTRRLRVRAGFFRLLVALLVFLAVAGGVGIWIGWQAWQYRQTWQEDRYNLERELAECKVRLERLSNMEALYERSRMAVVSVPPGEAVQSPPSHEASAASLPANAAPGATSAGVSTSGASLPGTPANAGGAASNATLPAENLGAPSTGSEEHVAVDTGVVRVENVVARLDDRRRLRVSVDLYNGDAAGQQISGKVVFTLLDADGQEYPISSDDMLFRIVRFKKMVISSALPSGVADAENAAIRVEVFVDDKLEFLRIDPVESR